MRSGTDADVENALYAAASVFDGHDADSFASAFESLVERQEAHDPSTHGLLVHVALGADGMADWGFVHVDVTDGTVLAEQSVSVADLPGPAQLDHPVGYRLDPERLRTSIRDALVALVHEDDTDWYLSHPEASVSLYPEHDRDVDPDL